MTPSKRSFQQCLFKGGNTALRNLYKCHGAAFSKGLDTEVGGKEMFLEKKNVFLLEMKQARKQNVISYL